MFLGVFRVGGYGKKAPLFLRKLFFLVDSIFGLVNRVDYEHQINATIKRLASLKYKANIYI
jgi:hypothetical protein